MLVLDNAIQCTEKDESGYQEMMAHLPLNCHPCPKNVLIIGGGDGGVAREVLKVSTVESVVQVEIDEEVVNVSKKFLPFMSKGSFDDPRMELIIEDGVKWLEQLVAANKSVSNGTIGNTPSNGQGQSIKRLFDVIITDSSDPIGPATVLFESNYYNLLRQVLEPNHGIICSQAENYWFELDTIKKLVKVARGIFGSVSYASTLVPSYPSGQIGFILCSIQSGVDFSVPTLDTLDTTRKNGAVERSVANKNGKEEEGNKSEVIEYKFYSKKIHTAAFVLPTFVTKVTN